MNAGIVIIGRNEASRLPACFESVRAAGCPVAYVDSGSKDGSADIARSAGVAVLELDRDRPFSAARARNEGFELLLRQHPGIDLVQFLDGDCTLLPGWIETATDAMRDQTDCAAALGHVIERNADASPYNRLCALEWKSSVGDLQNYGQLGGISLMRVDVFRQLGGFRPDVIAGEDSELGVRMALAGYRVIKLDCNMATHDANMTRFDQWWRRAVRAGHAIGQRADLNGNTAIRDCVRERRSTLLWGIALPSAVTLAAPATSGWSLALLLAYPVLGIRIMRRRIVMGDETPDAALYATFTVIGKFANAVGLARFAIRKLTQRYDIIEYK